MLSLRIQGRRGWPRVAAAIARRAGPVLPGSARPPMTSVELGLEPVEVAVLVVDVRPDQAALHRNPGARVPAELPTLRGGVASPAAERAGAVAGTIATTNAAASAAAAPAPAAVPAAA